MKPIIKVKDTIGVTYDSNKEEYAPNLNDLTDFLLKFVGRQHDLKMIRSITLKASHDYYRRHYQRYGEKDMEVTSYDVTIDFDMKNVIESESPKKMRKA